MDKKSLFALASLALILPLSLHAATTNFDATKVSKCINVGTKSIHTSAESKFEKDTAPYLKNALAENAIQAYKTSLTVAWEAMKEPYCGYGSPGPSSAKKSYLKTITRTRDTFLKLMKGLNEGITPIPTREVVPPPVQKTTIKKVTAPVSSPTKPIVRHTFSAGLARGMKASSVLDLQRVLFTHFKLDASEATTFFGARTEALVIRFQLERKIISSKTSPGAGRVGSKTAAALNTL